MRFRDRLHPGSSTLLLTFPPSALPWVLAFFCGFFLYIGGKREQAHEHLTAATTMYREMGMTYRLEQAEMEMRELA